jgi:hypothetical protein
MVRSDIIGGLKLALSGGDTLQNIMQSFYNAGYKKEDIEEAARALQSEGFQPQLAITKGIIQKPIQISQQVPIAQPQTNFPAQQPSKESSPPQLSDFLPVQNPITQVSSQRVSAYGPQKSSVDFVTILLVVVLVLLLGVLAAVFLFKTQLVEFLSKFLQ